MSGRKITPAIGLKISLPGQQPASDQPNSRGGSRLRQPLAGATLTALRVPAEGWIYDPATGTTTDINTTVDVTVTWTGQGTIERGVSTSHYSGDGYSYVNHSNGTRRDAAATGTVAGLPVSSADAVEYGANLGTTTDGSINITFPTR